MKKITKTLAVIVLIFAIYSCSSSSDNQSPSEETYIKFTADREGFNYTNPITTASQNLTINGRSETDSSVATFSSISIWFSQQVVAATFNFTGDPLESGDYKLNFESTPLSVDDWSSVNSVIITSVSSDYIEGTLFTGTVDGVSTTNEEFRAFNI